MKKYLALLTTLLAVSFNVNAAIIDFDDGTQGAAITNQYSSLGVTFSNARFDNFVSPDEAGVGAGGLKLVGNGAGSDSIYSPTAANPIVATFDFGITGFSIRALNVGANGARIEAYNSIGTLLDFDQAFGTGLGVDNHPLLASSAQPIFSILLFTPLSVTTEGMLWDNMSFTRAGVPNAVPLPAAVFMLAPALLGFMGLRRKAKNTAI